MSKQKYFYYVGVDTSGGMTLVTSIDKASKAAYWNKNEKPLPMTAAQADDLVFGLILNMTPAVVVKSRFELQGHFIAKSEE